MNAPDKFASLLTLTREPFPASQKTYITGSRDDLRVPLREVSLTNGEIVSLYDTSGPYSDPDIHIDLKAGLPGVRTRWIEERGDTEVLSGLSSEYGRDRANARFRRHPAKPPLLAPVELTKEPNERQRQIPVRHR
jgi:phosphomethylpyrimidine synthase